MGPRPQPRTAGKGWSRAVVKVLGIGAIFLSTAILARILTPVQFGLIATLSSLPNLLAFADVGVGYAFLSRLPRITGMDSMDRHAEITNGLLVISMSVLVAEAFAAGLCWTMPKAVGKSLGDVTIPAGYLLLGMGGVLIGVVLTAMLRIVQANGMADRVVTVQTLAGASGPLAVVLARELQFSIEELVIAVTWAPVTVLAASVLTLQAKRRLSLGLDAGTIDLQRMKSILWDGARFSVLTLLAGLAFQAALMIVSWRVGSIEAGRYSSAMRLSGLVFVVTQAALASLWPELARLEGNSRTFEALRLVRAAMRPVAIVGGGATCVILLLSPLIYPLCVGNILAPPTSLALAAGIWNLLQSIYYPLAMYLNARRRYTFQIITMTMMTMLNVILSICWAARLGATGPILASILSYVIFLLIPSSIVLWRGSHADSGARMSIDSLDPTSVGDLIVIGRANDLHGERVCGEKK